MEKGTFDWRHIAVNEVIGLPNGMLSIRGKLDQADQKLF